MKLIIILIVVLTMLAPLKGQSIVEKLPDGSYIVEIEGLNYRALTPDQMRKVQDTKAERDSYKTSYEALQQKTSELDTTYKELIKVNEDKFNMALTRERKQTVFWKSEYEKQLEVTKTLSNIIRKCTGKFLGLRVCWGF